MGATRLFAVLYLAAVSVSLGSSHNSNPKIVEVGPETGTLPPVVLGVDRCDNEPEDILSLVPPPGQSSAEAFVDTPYCDAWVVPVVNGVPDWTGATLLDLDDTEEQSAGPNRWAIASDAP